MIIIGKVFDGFCNAELLNLRFLRISKKQISPRKI
jgi:hypothetical protein